ncbi:lipid-A-disaccharide synthase [Dissulfurirhabdus thermomarina]|uniref:Lipid-A-disaccharide synthase n=1 Tax=Dissulfurirhabdus thermomarina TaxID=1765737 RepID=A0A6N9TNQ7_DISTH|nr:lipid-A-disaccharide synthase [Dissulfurirhabdus thermomarina]NDY42789.1 lipid-A-disaccharide synthase [Dissulfurirhabdus thermomarina]NMX23561.1 lipid-A-disaccharide synthase [Dissulfurirhabdus thermomarina]
MREPRVMIVAGEASGDLHAAGLVEAARRLRPGIRFTGIGGGRMREAGVEILVDAGELAVVGLVEILAHAGPIWRAWRTATRHLETRRPDVLVLVDYPGFNLLLARRARALGIPVFYYILPQVWAWRRSRVRKIRRRVSRAAVILPFEEDFFRAHGVEARFVGHPLLDHLRVQAPREELRRRFNLPPEARVVGLLPGSRYGELRRLLPVLVDTAVELHRRRPDLRFLLPLAPAFRPEAIRALPAFQREGAREIPLTLVHRRTYEAMAACDALVAASGTVTLEAAILGVPMVVVYRMAPTSYWLARRVVKIPFASLVNLIAKRQVVPEIFQEDVNPDRLTAEVLDLLENEERRRQVTWGLKEVRAALGNPGASDRAAAMLLDLLPREAAEETPAG